jgi:hypothetical protein
MPALMTLQGPKGLGCMGCTRPTSQPGTNGVSLAGSLAGPPLSGAASDFLSASPLTMIMGFAFGAFVAWRYALPGHGGGGGGVSGHRRRRR